jgi:FkbM family methyltransferase
MNILSLRLYELINKPLNFFGLELTMKRKVQAFFFKRIMQLKKQGFSPKVIFDCGAYKGEWSLMVTKIFPEAQIVLMEPNKNILKITEANISKINPSPILLEVALGDNPGTSLLNVWGNDVRSAAGASLLTHVKGNAATKIETEIDTLDIISKKLGFVPDFVKLDLQGAELLALKGAKEILKVTELFVIEFGLLEAYKNRASPRDLMEIMYENDYTLYDVVDLIYRPYDGTLVGGDFFFVKNDSFLRKKKDYY